MDKSELKKIIDKSIAPMRNALCLNEWTVQVFYETLGKSDHMRRSQIAESRPDPKYMDAWIKFYCEEIDDENEVLNTLRHELLHFLHADMQIMRRAVADMLTEKEFNVYTELHQHVCERIVHCIEALLDNLNFDPKKLIQHGKARRS